MAAHKIGITQPAVSQHLAKLESTIGSSLFERQGKRKVLNRAGDELYQHLSKDLRSIEDALRTAEHKTALEEDVKVRIALNRDIYFRICDKLAFDGEIEVFHHGSAAAVTSLLRREVDIAVSRIVPDSVEIIASKWFSDKFTVIYPKGWKQFGDKKSFLEKPFIMNLQSQEAIEEILLSMEIIPSQLRINRKLTDWLSLLRLVESGVGWSIAPSSFELSTKVQSLPIASKNWPTTQFYILYHRSIRNFAGVQKLIRSMIQSLS